MQTRLWLLIGVLLTANPLHAGDSFGAARRAQALLGWDTWSEIIRIENISRASRYARTVYALVFELAGRLWFYTDADGTQSLSLHRDRLAEEKADLGPLLRAIEPGFARWNAVPVDEKRIARGELPNGCFVESVAAWRARRAAGEEMTHVQLLAYYVETPSGASGHTVLTYTAGNVVKVIDPALSPAPMAFPGALADDAMALARLVHGGSISRARWLRLDEPRPALIASATGGDAPERAPTLYAIVTVR